MKKRVKKIQDTDGILNTNVKEILETRKEFYGNKFISKNINRNL